MADLASLGIVLVIAGIIIIVASAMQSGDTKFAVGGFIGPFPFGFGNDPGMVKLVLLISFIALLVFLLYGTKVVS